MVGFMKSALNLFGLKSKEGGEVSVGLDEFLQHLPDQMGYKVSFSRTETEDKGLHFEVEGEEVDSFLGDSSDMLDALSHISMRVLRKTEGLANAPTTDVQEALRVVFDSKGFREKKTAELRDFAAAQRQKVVESGGKPAYIPALGPSERKIIHTHLADLGEVVSESIGRGNFKRIRIRLKDDSTLRKPQEARQNTGYAGGGGSGNGNGSGGAPRGPRNDGGNGGRGRSHGRSAGSGGGRGSFSGERGNTRNPNFSEDRPMDDDIGNRLRPGEEPIFRYSGASAPAESVAPDEGSGHGDDFGNK